LKLKFNKPLSKFAFKLKLRRYTKALAAEESRAMHSIIEDLLA